MALEMDGLGPVFTADYVRYGKGPAAPLGEKITQAGAQPQAQTARPLATTDLQQVELPGERRPVEAGLEIAVGRALRAPGDRAAGGDGLKGGVQLFADQLSEAVISAEPDPRPDVHEQSGSAIGLNQVDLVRSDVLEGGAEGPGCASVQAEADGACARIPVRALRTEPSCRREEKQEDQQQR